VILAIASGKGGTGKTTVSANLARILGAGIRILDCDVEEPNAHLFLKGSLLGERTVSIAIPEVDESLCVGCGKCGKFCEYSAIVSFGATPLLFPEMCHGCGGCVRVCPENAISEVGRRIGVIQTIQSKEVTLIQGRLDIGVVMAPPLIRAVKESLDGGGWAILDAPPGTSCPVITTLRGADYVVLVTEPTPFGLHDLKLAVEMVKELGIPFGVVINRMGIGDDRVHEFCTNNGVPVLLEIPDDRRVAEAYSRGDLMIEALPEYRVFFTRLIREIVSSEKDRGSSRSRTYAVQGE
jgi:MinD superfamily P-loop ATPase